MNQTLLLLNSWCWLIVLPSMALQFVFFYFTSISADTFICMRFTIRHAVITHAFFLVNLSISWGTEYPGQFRNLIVSLIGLPVQLWCAILSFPEMFHFPVCCLLYHKHLKKLLSSLAFIDSNLFHRSRWTSKILTVTWALWQICIRIRTSTRALRTKPCWRTSNKQYRASKCSSLSHCLIFQGLALCKHWHTERKRKQGKKHVKK